MEKQPLLNIEVNNLSLAETVEAIDAAIARGEPAYLVEANVDVLVKAEKDGELLRIIRQADMVLPDGKPLIWVAGWMKRPLKEKVSGSDLVPALCAHAAEAGHSVYFLGGREEVLAKAVENLKGTYPGLKVAGSCSPPFGFEKDGEALAAINAGIRQARPDILFAFLGCPKQEKWIFGNYRQYQAKISVCAGGTVDFLAGAVKRAPRWMSDHGLEWFYRFCMEPRRLFKRYFIDDAKFLTLIWKYRPGRKP